MTRPDLRVAVTGFAGLEDPQSGPSIARALRDGWPERIEIHALGADAMSTGAWAGRVSDHIHRFPDGHDDGEALLARLLELHESWSFDALLLGCEICLPSLNVVADALEREGIRVLLPSPESLAAVQQGNWPKLLRSKGFATPSSLRIGDLENLAVQADLLGYPLLLKHQRLGARLVQSADEALRLARTMIAEGGRLLLQSAVGGEGYRVGLVADKEGNCRGLAALRKIAVDGEGRLVCGTIVEDREVTELALEVLDALKWCGALELELARPGGSSPLLVTDLRCCLPGWSMLSHWAGCNLPVLYLQEMLRSSDSERPKPRPGVVFLRGVSESAVALDDLLRLQRRGSVNGGAGPRRRAVRRPSTPGKLKVAVTGLSSFEAINPGLGVARCLRESGDVATLHGLAYGTLESGAFRGELFDTVHRLSTYGDPELLLQRVTEIHEVEPFDVILPCLDGELQCFLEIEARLAELGIATLLPTREALERRSKLSLFDGRRPNKAGPFAIPESRVVACEEGLLEAVKDLGLPAVVKGPLWSCIEAQSESEARAAWLSLRQQAGGKVIVQSRIRGDAFAVSAVCDRDHKLRTAITVKKVAQCGRGSTWSALQVSQPELVAGFADFLQDIGWSGPVEGEFIRDELSERFYLIEVNPRFTGWVYFTAAIGANQPELAAHLALGREHALEAVSTEMVFMRSWQELQVRPAMLAALSNSGFIKHASV